jgi:hypothetical protein
MRGEISSPLDDLQRDLVERCDVEWDSLRGFGTGCAKDGRGQDVPATDWHCKCQPLCCCTHSTGLTVAMVGVAEKMRAAVLRTCLAVRAW